MVIRKIAKFEKYAEDSYRVMYEGFVTHTCMSKVRFELAVCIDEFLRRAIDPKDIERLLDLVVKWFTEEM